MAFEILVQFGRRRCRPRSRPRSRPRPRPSPDSNFRPDNCNSNLYYLFYGREKGLKIRLPCSYYPRRVNRIDVSCVL